MNILFIFLSVFGLILETKITNFEYNSQATNDIIINNLNHDSDIKKNPLNVSTTGDCEIVDIKCPTENVCLFSILKGGKKQAYHMGIQQISSDAIEFIVFKSATSKSKIVELFKATWYMSTEFLLLEDQKVAHCIKPSGITKMKDAMDSIFECLIDIECKHTSGKSKTK